tara:strand:+ start:192 stop:374 length:183 start_codon:yes stop_codon:yes gene_type:complete
MSEFNTLELEADDTGRVVELLNYSGDDELMPKYMVKVNGVLVFHGEDFAQAQYEYSMECE